MRVNYIKYNQNTGEIRQWGDCAPDNPILSPSHDEGELKVMVGVGTNTTHYVDLSDLTIKGKPSQPSDNYVFDYVLKEWVDPRSFADMQALKWEDIKKFRDAAEFGPFQYNGMEFDGDVDAQRRLSGYISISKGAIAAEQPFSAVFTLANNTEVLLTAQDFVGIEIAKVSSVAAAFSKAADLRKQIEAAGTLAELNAINW